MNVDITESWFEEKCPELIPGGFIEEKALRLADSMEWRGGKFLVTRTWRPVIYLNFLEAYYLTFDEYKLNYELGMAA